MFFPSTFRHLSPLLALVLLVSATSPAAAQLGDVTAPVTGGSGDTTGGVVDGVGTVTDAVNDVVEGAGDAVGDATDAAGGAAGDATDTVNGAIGDTTDTVNGAIGDTTDAVNGAVDGATDAVDGAVDGADGTLEGLVDGVTDVVDGLPAIVQLWDQAEMAAVISVFDELEIPVGRHLPVVMGFQATIPADLLAVVAQLPAVRAVTPDALVLPLAEPADGGEPSVYRQATGAHVVQQAGHRGHGVTVALIDTGITEVPDLAGRLVTVTDPSSGQPAGCVNLSDEPGCTDTYGHGTFIAGLIAGDGSSSAPGQSHHPRRGAIGHVGIAPAADLIALKLSGRDGRSQVSDVLAAIGWVVENRELHSIDVLNLSLRTNSDLSYRVDPLNLAVERAWAAGIVVVVSAGNLGGGERTIAKPADDPWVITVGSTDDGGTVGVSDDVVSSFSSRGPTDDGVAKPDLVVPGRSLISLRSPGSAADEAFPAFVDSTYRRGSGTSFSAGIVSGAAAVMLSADPTLTNDQIKHALTATAIPIAGAGEHDAGAGSMDIASALDAPRDRANTELFHPLFSPSTPPSSGDVAGTRWEGSNWEGSNWEGSNWEGSNWEGSNWEGSNWEGSNWEGSNWEGSNWEGSNWEGSNWEGSNWEGSNWEGSNWEGSNWEGSNWESEHWS